MNQSWVLYFFVICLQNDKAVHGERFGGRELIFLFNEKRVRQEKFGLKFTSVSNKTFVGFGPFLCLICFIEHCFADDMQITANDF